MRIRTVYVYEPEPEPYTFFPLEPYATETPLQITWQNYTQSALELYFGLAVQWYIRKKNLKMFCDHH
jgi:hypothetical protein